MSSDNARNKKKQTKSNSQHGSRSTGPQTAGLGSSTISSSANAGTSPREPSLSGKTREFLRRATDALPTEPPHVSNEDVQENNPVDDDNAHPTNPHPII